MLQVLVAGNNGIKYYFENKSNKEIPRKISGIEIFIMFFKSPMQILEMSGKE